MSELCSCNVENCGKIYKDYRCLALHILKQHKMNSKEYYDKYCKAADEGLCLVCNTPCSFHDIKNGYNKFCSTSCSRKYTESHPELKEKVRESFEKTSLEHFGSSHPCKSKKIKEKIFRTNLEKYGTKMAISNEEFKVKAKNTCIKKYGTDSFSKTNEFLEKSKKTFLDHFGVDNPSKNEDIRQKISESVITKYGSTGVLNNPESMDKFKATMKEKYNVSHPMNIPEVKQKFKENKNSIQEKRLSTLESKYGIPRTPSPKTLVFRDQEFDSMWEIYYYAFCKYVLKLNIIRNIKRNFKYYFNNNIHKYFPDFIVLINNKEKFIEIKGSNMIDKNGYWISISDPSRNEVFKAKQACAKENKVLVVTHNYKNKLPKEILKFIEQNTHRKFQ